jgi:hypothetical protein
VWGATGLSAWVTVARAYPVFALVLLGSALLSCPWLLPWGRGWVRDARSGPTSERSSPPSWHRDLLTRPEVVVPDLGTATLCELWRESGTWVSRISAPSTLLSVVRLRDALIEEFLRRSPDEADAWLRSESLASSDPARFLSS